MTIGDLFRKVAGADPMAGDGRADHGPLRRVLIVGNPNVGKSALFNRLTGQYVTVSNYPGTTVEIARAKSRLLPADVEVIDTPGMYSLLPITEEERVARELFLTHRPLAVVHVVDAKNLERMLPLTLQLLEAHLPVVLALNMSDEARQAGIAIDHARLERALGVPVVATSATTGEGIQELARRITLEGTGVRPVDEHGQSGDPPRWEGHPRAGETPATQEAAGQTPMPPITYGPALEEAVARVSAHLGSDECLSLRARALLLLQQDKELADRLLRDKGPQAAGAVEEIIRQLKAELDHSPHYHVALTVRTTAESLLDGAVTFPQRQHRQRAERLSRFCMSPLTGIPLLLGVLYLGLYQFVGVFGAGTLVGYLEDSFQRWVNPFVNRTAESLIGWPPLRELFAGDYGIVTLGLRYAVAIILPIVGTFFLAFSILEDSGYLPRLAMLIDRLFKKIGLTGRAVIPIVLGFGCDTMATLVTRTLETKRERLIATILLALAIPCSAQVGVILGLLAGHPLALAVWAGVIAGVFLATGLAAAKVLPGERPSFYMELPPLRLPRLGNVLVKTYTRLVWYFKEILPLFVLASALIWIGRLTGLFALALRLLEPLMRTLGLPDGAATAFLFGFFRRDYGAAGLFDLHRHGALTGNQLAVAAVTLTLFLPCVAQFLVMKKERGWRITLAVAGFVAVFAFVMGFAVNLALNLLGAHL